MKPEEKPCNTCHDCGEDRNEDALVKVESVHFCPRCLPAYVDCAQCGEEMDAAGVAKLVPYCVECRADAHYQWAGDFEHPSERAERLTTTAEYLRELKEDR
jgi:hypothetical protein